MILALFFFLVFRFCLVLVLVRAKKYIHFSIIYHLYYLVFLELVFCVYFVYINCLASCGLFPFRNYTERGWI